VTTPAAGEVAVMRTSQGRLESIRYPCSEDAYRHSSAAAVPTVGATVIDRRGFEAVEHIGPLCGTRVLIVDDCALYRDYLVSVIMSQGAVTAGIAWDRPSLVEAFEAMRPGVVLLNMRSHDSVVLLRQALRLSPPAPVVVFGVSGDDEAEIVGCAEAGVSGYHLRSETLDDLITVIQKVADGEFLCSPGISAILLHRISALAAQQKQPDKELLLTAREIQILRMLEAGLANQVIAEELCIAVHTVKNHVHSLLTKLGVTSRAQAAALARTILPNENAF
jgi:DNA-binding NarL/FixJ family response regulator